MGSLVVEFSVDSAEYIGDEIDGVYVQAGEGAAGWFVTCVVDSDTGGFVDNLVTDEGPYDTEEEAMDAGRNHAREWCAWNDVEPGDG